MNKYHAKLKSIPLDKYKDFKLLDVQYICAGSLSTYSYVDIPNTIIIPEEFKNAFFMTHLAIRGQVVPHKDQGIKCKILIYLSDNHATTRFYESSNEADFTRIAKDCSGCNFEKFSSGECACSFKPTNLTLIEQFEAKPHDIYLIDTTAIHSVDELSADNPRLALSIATSNSYNDTYKMLEHFGLLDV